MGQITTPWKKLYLATTRNYACVSKTANIIYIKKLQAIYSMLYKQQIFNRKNQKIKQEVTH